MHKHMPIDFHYIQIDSDLDGFGIYDALGNPPDSILLDSSKIDSPYSRYSIMGVNPFLIVKYENQHIYTKDYRHSSHDFEASHDLEKSHSLEANHSIFVPDFKHIQETDIFAYLNKIIHNYSLINTTELPFIGGGIGYFSYDLSKELEVLPHNAVENVSVPDCYYVFYDNVVLKEIHSHNTYITGLGLLKPSRLSIDLIRRALLDTFEKPDAAAALEASTPIVFKSPFTKATYMDAVEVLRQYIENGDIYITNMTHTFQADFTENPLSLYRKLRALNPAPFSAYMPFPDFTVLCSSPERFISIRNGHIQTRPIKGTLPRGASPVEDEDNKATLLASEKDKSELLMIVDLERNDLSKVCQPKSVHVTELFAIEAYATVFHLVATIEGQLQTGLTAVDCMKATFPGGSITGAPKIRSMEIIDELEPTRRNLYTGCIGYLGFDNNADFNIVIRTILIKDNIAYIGVGGGITWESDAESEYNETLQKAKALFESLGATYIDE